MLVSLCILSWLAAPVAAQTAAKGTRPWTFAVPLTVNDDEPVFEYACHEGNYAVRNMLSATRAEEKGR
jgi:hypothetical protein